MAGTKGTGHSTPTYTESASKEFLYGTPEEVGGRLEHGLGPTESHFQQIRPSTAAGGAAAKQSGTTRNNRANVRHRG